MADDFACVGLNITDDPRLVGASLAEFGLAGFLHLYADDWGRFDANPAILARRIGASVEEVAAAMKVLIDRGIVRTWTYAKHIGLIGEIVGFHQFSHGETRRYEYKRRASRFPDEHGVFPERTPHRAKETDDAQPEKPRKPKRKAAPSAGGKKGKNGEPRIEESRGDKTAEVGPSSLPQTKPEGQEPKPAGPPASPPSSQVISQPSEALTPRARLAMASWLSCLARMNPTATVEPSALEGLASEVPPEVFVRAVERHIDAPDHWHTPLRALRWRCEWAQADANKAEEEAKADAATDAIVKARREGKSPSPIPIPVHHPLPESLRRETVESDRWEEALCELRDRMGPYDFRHYIASLRCVGDDGRTLTLEANDETHARWVGEHFGEAVEAAASSNVKYVVG